MPIARYQLPDGRVARFEVPDGTSPESAQQIGSDYFASQGPKDGVIQSNGHSYGRATKQEDQPGQDLTHELVRGGAIAGRDALTGVAALPLLAADATTGVANVPIRMAGGQPMESPSSLFQQGLGAMGGQIPGGQLTNSEKLASAATRGAVGALGGAGVAGEVAGATSGTASGVAQSLAVNPGLQSVSGASAGASGELARQNGAGPGGQILASLAGGLAPAVGATAFNTLTQPRQLVQSAQQTAKTVAPEQIEQTSQQAVKKLGLDWNKVDDALKDSIRENVNKALAIGGDITPEAAVRNAIYESQGLKTTKALVTRNFEDALTEQDLMTKPEGGPLRQIYDQNNATIKSKLQALAPQNTTPVDQPSFGQSLRSDIEKGADKSAEIRDKFYAVARVKEGENSADIGPLFGFMQKNRSRLATSNADSPVISYLKDAGILTARGASNLANGKPVSLSRYPTLNELTDLRKVVNNAATSTLDKNTQSLLGSMRGILDDAEASAGGDAFKQARNVFGRQKSVWEGNPLLVNLLKDKRGFRGVDTIPDEEVFNKTIINSSNDDFKSVWDRAAGPQKDLTRAQLGRYIEDKVFSNMGTNERGDVVASAAKLSRALDTINPQKLEIIYGAKKAGDLQLLAKSLREISSPPRGTVPQGSAPKIEMLTRSLLGALKVGAKLPSVVGNTIGGVANMIKSGAESKSNISAIEDVMSPLGTIQTQKAPLRLMEISPGAAPIVSPLERLQSQ